MCFITSEPARVLAGFRGASPELLGILLSHVSTSDMFKDRAMFDKELLLSATHFMGSAVTAVTLFAGRL